MGEFGGEGVVERAVLGVVEIVADHLPPFRGIGFVGDMAGDGWGQVGGVKGFHEGAEGEPLLVG